MEVITMATQVKQRVAPQQNEVRVRGVAREAAQPAPTVTAEDVKAMVEAQLQAAYEQALAQQRAEIAEPSEGIFRWDILGFGPIQIGTGVFPLDPPPYRPNQVMRVGELAFAVSIMILPPGNPIHLFALPYEITYSTGNLKTWSLGPASLQHVSTGNWVPGVPFVVDVFPFVPDQEGLYETNISARILDAVGGNATPFSGFARSITKIEPALFLAEPLVMFDTGMRYQVYA
jgi:hypothetical protein